MKRILSFIILAMSFCMPAMSQEKAPEMAYVMTLNVELGESYSVGKTAHGDRFVIPITGGTFEGEGLKGIVLPGGADWQLSNKELNRTEVEAIYSVRTDDGVNIHIRNRGIIVTDNGQFYFRCAPQFEAPADSKYAWLNNSLFICSPSFGGKQGTITLNIWKVL